MSFLERFQDYKKAIDNELELFLSIVARKYKHSINADVYREIFDFVMTGGKRLRALALLMAYKAVGGQDNTGYKLSICIELLHNSTLIHDDIIDRDEKRRNAPTFHKKFQEVYKLIDDQDEEKTRRFGESIAILAGNILYELGLEVINRLPAQISHEIKAKLIDIYASTYRRINEGQILDLAFENRFPTEKEYYEMVQLKTGALFEAALLMGVILAQGSEEQIDTFVSFGIPAFTAFQIQDDILGTFGTDKWGKNIESDLREGKRTLLIIKTLEKLSGADRDFFISALGNQTATSEELERVRTLIKRSSALDYAKTTAKELITRAKNQLVIEPSLKKEGLEFFEAFADFLIARAY